MKHAARKLAMLLITMVAVSFFAFLAFQVLSGDPATQMLGTQATPERVEALRHEMGLDRPFLLRYGEWLAGFFIAQLGTSYSYGVPVAELVGQKLPVTAVLTAMSFLMIAALSVPLGIFSGRRHGGALDRGLTVLNQIVMAVPPFFTGILFTWLFGLVLHWFTPGGYVPWSESRSGFLGYLILPALSIALPRAAMCVRMMRGTILAELHKDYVRTSLSRGGDSRYLLYRHVLKNSAVPLVTFLAQTMAEIVAGSVVVEQVFAIPGLGRLLLGSISGRDFPVAQAIVVLIAFWVVAVNTAADLINQRIDPRLRLEADHE
ncbi:ABC transporter permease [Oscillibacter hominis]|uniref:ABC transporter permease n=1 Tax=Oscillibacter hominis TaxID=2763056 RepID=A0A7G9B4E2_9FIRM|nr:ABC transporter permease [Oscillibacter hominis]QNL44423.1 ABC transporter permease [Oscillibacter hominis]